MNINIYGKLKNLSPKVQIVIIAAVPVVLIALFIFLFYLPKNKEIKSLDLKIGKLNQEIESSQEKTKILKQLIEENKQLKLKLARLKEQLPEEKEVSELLKQISESGLQSGLEILLWKPEARKTNPEKLYVEIPVSVEVSTGYHNLGLFFSHISRLPRLVNISDLNLSIGKTKKGVESRGLINAEFTARTFASVSDEERASDEAEKDEKGDKKKQTAKKQKQQEKK